MPDHVHRLVQIEQGSSLRFELFRVAQCQGPHANDLWTMQAKDRAPLSPRPASATSEQSFQPAFLTRLDDGRITGGRTLAESGILSQTLSFLLGIDDDALRLWLTPK